MGKIWKQKSSKIPTPGENHCLYFVAVLFAISNMSICLLFKNTKIIHCQQICILFLLTKLHLKRFPTSLIVLENMMSLTIQIVSPVYYWIVTLILLSYCCTSLTRGSKYKTY